MEQRDRIFSTKTGANEIVGNAKYCSWSRLYQLFPVEDMHDGDGDILAWHIRL